MQRRLEQTVAMLVVFVRPSDSIRFEETLLLRLGIADCDRTTTANAAATATDVTATTTANVATAATARVRPPGTRSAPRAWRVLSSS